LLFTGACNTIWIELHGKQPSLMSFLALFASVSFLLCLVAFRSYNKAARLSRSSWEDLVAMIEPVETDGITAVALEYLNPTRFQLGMEPNDIWQKVGGIEGLTRMRANADVLIALAAYTQRWNFDEGTIVAERMRHDGLALRRAARRITVGLVFGYGSVRGPFYVHEAASSYYLMRQRLLALYETSHAGRYPQLAAAL